MSQIAKAGDIVTCEGGHELYRITADVYEGDYLRVEQFEPIHELAQRPAHGAEIEPCPVCGRPWHRGTAWVRVHFQDGWRG